MSPLFPIDKLPVELLQRVFGQVNGRLSGGADDRIRTVFPRVCKAWREALRVPR